jgi:hypothetical protein
MNKLYNLQSAAQNFQRSGYDLQIKWQRTTSLCVYAKNESYDVIESIVYENGRRNYESEFAVLMKVSTGFYGFDESFGSPSRNRWKRHVSVLICLNMCYGNPRSNGDWFYGSHLR